MNAEQVIASVPVPKPSIERHDAIVAVAEKQFERAKKKRDEALFNYAFAEHWLEKMKAERSAFVDEQGMLL